MRHPLSLDALIDWLSRQPAEGEYDWDLCYGCLGFQWIKAAGLPIRSFGRNHWYDKDRNYKVLDFRFSQIAYPFPRTYSAALERAKAMAAAHD